MTTTMPDSTEPSAIISTHPRAPRITNIKPTHWWNGEKKEI